MNRLGLFSRLAGLAFWSKAKDVKTATSVDVARTIQELRARYNPLRNFTPDKLVRAIDAWRIGTLGELARILEELEQRDDMIMACSEKMKAAVARCQHSVKIVEGYEDDPDAQAHKKYLERFYANIQTSSVFCRNEKGGFRLLVKQMMDAVHARYAVHEITWEPRRDGYIRAKFQFVPLWMFENHTGELRYLEYYGAYDGVKMNPGEWLVTVGSGVGIPAAVAAMSKRLSINDWLLFSEKCGTPGLHATTEAPEGSETWDKLVDALRNFGRDWSILTDSTTKINTVSLAQGASLPHPELVRYMNKAISVLYRGADLSTLSGEGGDANGASLQGKESNILEQDACEMVSEALQEQIDKFVLRYRFGEGVTPLAYIQVEPQAKQDAQLDMSIDKHLVSLGAKLSKNDALQRYGRTEYKPEDTADAPLEMQGGAGAEPGPEARVEPPGGLPVTPQLANEDGSRERRVAAWKNLQADLSDALEACKNAILSKDAAGFAAALGKLPKTVDGQRLAASLEDEMKRAMHLSNAAPGFEEGDHPRGHGGKFVRKEGAGREFTTHAYVRENGKQVLDENGDHVYSGDPVEEKFSFGKGPIGASKTKKKPTPNLDEFKAEPRQDADKLSGLSEDGIYRRGGNPIDYGTHVEVVKKGKNKGQEVVVPNAGEPKFEWTIGGKPVDKAKAVKLEAALKEGGMTETLAPGASDVRVRRDFASGRGQVYQLKGGTGKTKTVYDPQTERDNQKAKFKQVDSIVRNYDGIMDRIEADCGKGNTEACVAYFLSRTKCRIGGGSGDNLGALDLTPRNVSVSGDTVSLDFDAKNSHWKQKVEDPFLARWIGRRLRDCKPGDKVLGGMTNSQKVNGYLSGVGEQNGVVGKGDKGFTAHNFRHAGATRLAGELVDRITVDPAKDRAGYLGALADVVRQCARHIGDDPKTAFEKYIHPSYLFKNAPELLEEDRKWRFGNEAAKPKDDKTAKSTDRVDFDDEEDGPGFYTAEDMERMPVLKELLALLD